MKNIINFMLSLYNVICPGNKIYICRHDENVVITSNKKNYLVSGK